MNNVVPTEDSKYEAMVSAYLWNRLSERTQRFIIPSKDEEGKSKKAKGKSKGVETPTLEQLSYSLLNDLNYIIQGESIYDDEDFPANELKGKIEELASQEPLGETERHEKELAEEIQKLIKQEPRVETLRLNRLLLELIYPEVFGPAEMCKPMHIVNITLNLVGGKKLAWQDRQAESFTVSALHSGSYCVGYRNSHEYALNNDNEAISLGTAMAISGAAASPNMGYYSSTFVTFLLALFNVRLGWWLGNPKKDSYKQAGPTFAARPIIAETLGLTDDEHPYVYLSDGGHFENLGLYEMVLRRCKRIVISDGSADPDFGFEGLGNAISKVRVDLGVPIEIERIFMLPRDEKESERGYGVMNPDFAKEKKFCAVGRICYSRVDRENKDDEREKKDDEREEYDGILIYIKAFLSGTEPVDVYNYAKMHKLFPHESTADQMYSESQFESYRALGLHIVDKIYWMIKKTGDVRLNLEDFFSSTKHSFPTKMDDSV
ncbi:MAG: hypothetical protein AUG51_04765 [Acidobacteria bacterium 13_1_20CM_3_53_8]|nr:MAG: hypothetical protein AUG51_04765 [Acidobacteria bacterium 13_1_20CM_3_53_8]